MIVDAEILRGNNNKVEISVNDGKLVVTAPYNMDDSTLRDILISHANWYKDKTSHQPCSKPTTSNTVAFNKVQLVGEMYCCKKVLIAGKLFEVVGGDVTKTILDGSKVVVCEKVFGHAEKRRKAIAAFLKMIANDCLRREISQFGTKVALCPSAIKVADLKGDRWIRCSDMQNRVVTIDFRAIQLPSNLRNYLIAHVFSHFFSPGHDSEFYRTLYGHLNDFESLQNMLEKYSFVKEIV